MRDDTTGGLLARGYGLALGLALGAAVCTVPPAWREAVASACWMADVESGPGPGTSCAGPIAADPAELVSMAMQVPAVGPGSAEQR